MLRLHYFLAVGQRACTISFSCKCTAVLRPGAGGLLDRRAQCVPRAKAGHSCPLLGSGRLGWGRRRGGALRLEERGRVPTCAVIGGDNVVEAFSSPYERRLLSTLARTSSAVLPRTSGSHSKTAKRQNSLRPTYGLGPLPRKGLPDALRLLRVWCNGSGPWSRSDDRREQTTNCTDQIAMHTK